MSRSTLVSLAQILLIQIILIRKNTFVKRKIGNLFETKADDGKLSKIGEVFSDDGTGIASLTGEHAQATLRGRPRGRLGTVGSGKGRVRGRPRRLGSIQGAGGTL